MAHIDLDLVQRLEIAGARFWPAEKEVSVGNWEVRIDGAMASKRLNSINPTSPGAERDFVEKLSAARDLLAQKARPPLFRMTPLAGEVLSDRLDMDGWARFETSHVMMLDQLYKTEEPSGVPTQVSAEQFSQAWAQVRGLAPEKSADVMNVLSRIEAQTGLFVIHGESGEPAATAICVRDGDLAGFFEVAVAEPCRRRGLAREIMRQGMHWARKQGARGAWLQVLADNDAATGLYCTLGFEPIYCYHYRKPPGDQHG